MNEIIFFLSILRDSQGGTRSNLEDLYSNKVRRVNKMAGKARFNNRLRLTGGAAAAAPQQRYGRLTWGGEHMLRSGRSTRDDEKRAGSWGGAHLMRSGRAGQPSMLEVAEMANNENEDDRNIV